jgi:tetratricopeptide (TPR) repeat protein
MTSLSRARDLLRTVTLYRRKGDAAARRGDHQEAERAWNTGLTVSEELFDALSITPELEPTQAQSLDADVAVEAAELLGVRGGLLRRLGRAPDALKSYRKGAQVERSHELPQTYNRANAIKYTLIDGDKTLAQLHDELTEFQEWLNRRVSTDERAADESWLWADLGDIRLLLGDDQGAESAYQNFVEKARSDSPISTLAVLKEIVAALYENGDPDSARVADSLASVEPTITTRLRK